VHGIITFIAKDFIVLSVIGTALIWWRLPTNQKKQFVIFAIVGAILSILLAKLGSHLHNDPRPFVVGHFTPYFAHGNDNGFPSDHTLFTSFLAFTVWHYSRRGGQILLLIAVLVGLSRVIAGVHHLQDIIGSMLFALLGTWLAWKLIKRYLPTSDNRPRQRRTPQPDAS